MKAFIKRSGMGTGENRLKSGLVEWINRNTLRWFGHLERMNNV